MAWKRETVLIPGHVYVADWADGLFILLWPVALTNNTLVGKAQVGEFKLRIQNSAEERNGKNKWNGILLLMD